MGTRNVCEILRHELPARQIPASSIAALADITSSRLSKYLLGSERCPLAHEESLYAAWSRLRQLIEFASPLPLNFSKVNELRRCIEMMESNELQIIIFQPDRGETESASQ